MALKPTHAKELWGMIVGYERPLHSSTLRPARENCESCHYPQAIHRDSVARIKRYATDDKSSEIEYRLTLHTTAGMPRDATARATGIHWHVTNEVTFVSPDTQSRTIPWVQVRHADGSTATYTSAEAKLTPEDLATMNKRRMECYDCHNAVGHPFKNPADVVDEAITAGQIDRSLPSVKARAVAMIESAGDLSGGLDDRAARVDQIIADNAAKAKTKPDLAAKEQQFQKTMKEILLRTSFSEKGLTWKSFPNHVGHKDFAGCFRCHDGKHFNEKGEAIRLQCTLCHNLPQVTLESGKSTVASTVAPGMTQPDFHSDPNFMHDHRTKVDQSCAMCHGELKFGREGGNFCANPACHGRAWPEVDLNALPKTAEAPAAAPAAAGAGTSKPAPAQKTANK
jgi:hypothetical protein